MNEKTFGSDLSQMLREDTELSFGPSLADLLKQQSTQNGQPTE